MIINRNRFISLILLICSFSPAYSKNLDSLEQLSNSKNLLKQAESLIELSKHYHSVDSLKAKLYYSKFTELELSELPDSAYRSIVIKHATYLKSSFQHKASIVMLNKEINKASLSNDSSSLALYHQLITPHYFYTFNYDSCDYYLDEAIKIYEGFKDTNSLGLLKVRKSGVQYAKGDYEKAIKYAFEATELFKGVQNQKQLAIACLQLGNIFYFLKDFRESEQYYGLASTAFLNDNNQYGHYQALSNIGLIKVMLEEFTTSIPIQLQALSFFEKNGYELELGNSYRYLSLGYYGIQNYDSSTYYNELALASDRISKYTIGYSEGCLTKAKIFFQEENYIEALKCANEAFSLADSIEHAETKKMLSFHLSLIHEKLGNIDSSYKYLKLHLSLKDSLDLDPKKLKDYGMLHQFRIEETEFNLILSKERERMQEQLNTKREGQLAAAIIIAVISISLLILAILIIIRNRKLTQELAEQEKLIRNELQIKESLLGEIHHRVKNNLQIISSMLSLQSQYINDDYLQKVIDDCKGRITSMSLIHESLYMKIDLKQALFGTYVKNLIPRLIETYQIDESKIKLRMDIEEIQLTLDESIPCGLMINEIVTNLLKHAFPKGANGEIYLSLIKEKDRIKLTISDNGIGLKKEETSDQKDSFGFLLIDTLANQLEADLELDTKEGLSYNISWTSK